MAMSVGNAIGYLDLDTSKFQSALKTASSQLKGFTDSSKSTGDRITSLGIDLTDNQLMGLLMYSQGGIKALENFRNQQADIESN